MDDIWSLGSRKYGFITWQNRDCIATCIERQTRWYTAIAMPNRSAASMNRAIARLQHQLPPAQFIH